MIRNTLGRARFHRLSVVLFSLAAVNSADASETITYNYDALGRLVQSTTSGTVNNGLTTATVYDSANNRSSQTVSGATKSGNGVRVVVVPLNGFTIIPLAPNVQ